MLRVRFKLKTYLVTGQVQLLLILVLLGDGGFVTKILKIPYLLSGSRGMDDLSSTFFRFCKLNSLILFLNPHLATPYHRRFHN